MMATTALTKYKFDSDDVPWTSGWEVEPTDVLNENQSEGGTDIVQAIRRNKLRITVQTGVMLEALKFFMTYKNKDSFTLTMYDPIAEEATTHNVRIKNFRYAKKAKSEFIGGTYSVSFTIEEF